VNEEFDFNLLDKVVASLMKQEVENGQVEVSQKLTKSKTQINLPIPMDKVNGHQIFFRVRHQVYTKNYKKRSNFLNQICFYYRCADGKSKCFKVFKNGVVHVTGFADFSEMDAATATFVHNLALWIGATQSNFTWKTVDVFMVNASFKLSNCLDLVDFHYTVLQTTDWLSMYEPEMYCGLMLDTTSSHNSPHFKANVFRTGSVILTGVKSYSQIVFAFSCIMGFFQKYLNNRIRN
jgi:TATA-box binding protein (TBP) (component of TFIID and TFIIIB)